MREWLSRQDALLGGEASASLRDKRIAVIGLGGVGGAAVEALARCGVGRLFLMDHDVFDVTNLNRQILATRDTVGKSKAKTAAARVHSIDPDVGVTAADALFCADTVGMLAGFCPDIVIDAVDMVTAKLLLAEVCADNGYNLLCCLGTGNRVDASAFRVGDMEETKGCGCGLARVMRRELRKRGLDNVTALFSETPPVSVGGSVPASIAFVPPVAGYLLAGQAVRVLLGLEKTCVPKRSDT